MKSFDRSFQEFVDALEVADDVVSLQRVAARTAQRLGFRWFAYLVVGDGGPRLISSYPSRWTGRYLDLEYQRIDPVVRRACRDLSVFRWDGAIPKIAESRQQRLFFEEAETFGVRTGITVPVAGAFGCRAIFTMATDEQSVVLNDLAIDGRNLVQLVALYFHAHVSARLGPSNPISAVSVLSQRERQCLAWSARGKTIAEIATILEISARTVSFHMENARRKLNAVSLSQSVAIAVRAGLLA